MTLREKIEVMEASERGEEIECKYSGSGEWFTVACKNPEFRWEGDNYRIKPKPKQIVVIERWLCYDNLAESYSICAESNIDGFINDDRAYLSKVKLLDTYEVTL